MPVLSIIPAAAVADPDLSDTQVRVLCAIGTFTNRLGGNVWASVQTMAKTCNLSTRTVQRALPVLIAKGYLRQMPRPGKTSVYEVVLESPLTPQSLGGDRAVTPPPTQLCHPNEKKNDKLNDLAQQVTKMIWSVYPDRDTPHLFPPALRAIKQCLQDGADPAQLVKAAEQYAKECFRKQTEPRFVRSLHRFFADGAWLTYESAVTVHGRTREEWARSGQDVQEFDRLATELSA